MTEENIEKLIAMIKEESYVPSGWMGINETKVINSENVLLLIQQLRIL